jgi:NTP pyrophosphatase (non-canonical NTP hydrolase)
MSDITKLQDRAMEIRRRYNDLEKQRGSQPWDGLKLAQGFKKDVTDLVDILEQSKLDQKKLSHELADCLWSVLVIARKLNVDIERAFWTTMLELDNRLDGEAK